MSKFLHLGMSLPRTSCARRPSRPAEILGLEREVGTLRPGRARRRRALPPAATGSFPLYDIWGEMREARRLLVNTLDDRGRPAARAAAAAGARRPGRRDPIWPEAQKPFTERQQAFRDRGHTPTQLRAAAEAEPDDYWTSPRAATGQRPSTAPPSTTVTAFARLIAGQTWFGTIATRSPIAHVGAGRHARRRRAPR